MISGVFRLVTSPISFLSSKLTGTSKSATEWSGKQSTTNAKGKRKKKSEPSSASSSASQPKRGRPAKAQDPVTPAQPSITPHADAGEVSEKGT